MRIRSLLAPTGLSAAALLAALATAPSAVGGGSTITVGPGTSYTPAHTKVAQGTTVTWTFQGFHTTTSNQGFWNSGRRSSGTFTEPLPSAGRFPYHCTIHAGMTGSVAVPLKASGSAGSGWTLRWSASSAGSGRAFDVQTRRQGTTTWSNFRANTSSATGFFNPSPAGTYQIRARTSNTNAGKESGWSPVISKQIS